MAQGASRGFAVSGSLITSSWLSRPRVCDYLAARRLRILPGRYVCLVVSAFATARWVRHSGRFDRQAADAGLAIRIRPGNQRRGLCPFGRHPSLSRDELVRGGKVRDVAEVTPPTQWSPGPAPYLNPGRSHYGGSARSPVSSRGARYPVASPVRRGFNRVNDPSALLHLSMLESRKVNTY